MKLFLTSLSFITAFSCLQAQDTLLKAHYIYFPYEMIPDSRVTFTEKEILDWKLEVGDIKQFYAASFEVKYSEKDSAETYQFLKNNTADFADNFRDTNLLTQFAAITIKTNPASITSYKNQPAGSIISYVKDNELYVGKIIGLKQIPDSVRARHILFRSMPADQVETILNDLKNNRVSWEDINAAYNGDYGSIEKGGDLGYFTQGIMVEPFDNLCFEQAVQGIYYRVETQFGQHIVQLTDRKMSNNTFVLQLLSFISPIVPSRETIKNIEEKALRCVDKCNNIDELEAKLKAEGVEFQPLTFTMTDSKQLTDWMQSAQNGDITKTPIRLRYDFVNKEEILIAGLRSSHGESIRTEDLINQYGYFMNRQKKAELLFEEIKDYPTLESISGKYQLKIKNLVLPLPETKNGPDEFTSGNSLHDQLFNLELNTISEPILGYNGVYITNVFWRK